MNHHPQLSVSGLTFRYQDDNILKNLTMDFGAHQVTGLSVPTAAENPPCL